MDKQTILKSVFGYHNFRPLQEQAIDKIIAGEDVLLILSTGGGKSLCYQLPALLMKGVLIVISPLKALMYDQIHGLSEKEIPSAMISSEQSLDEIHDIQRKAKNNEIKILFITPERLQSLQFLDFLGLIDISFFAIDEAHCVSEWGHDFRSDYRQLGLLKDTFPGIGIAAFTATATHQVEQDIVKQLKFNQPDNIIRGKTYRDNLFISSQVRHKNGYQQLLIFLDKRKNERGIIYTQSRSNVDTLSEFLSNKGLRVGSYHAGLDKHEKKLTHTNFLNDDIDIVVATIAFGMGIDKSNIRFVVHMSMPKTIEAYYQEIGRSGRDGLPSDILLLYSASDVGKLTHFIDNIEDDENRKNAYHKLNLIKKYAFSEGCRHRLLSLYFDDHIQNCESQCDNCVSPDSDRTDITELAIKFLYAVQRTGERYGQTHVIDVLVGSKNTKVLNNKHQNLDIYAKGVETSKTNWKIIGDRLLEIDALSIGEYQALKLTNIASQIVKSQQAVDIKSCNLNTISVSSSNTNKDKYDVDNVIFDALRTLRKAIAKEANMPAYVIFDDKALKEMAYFLPTNSAEFLKINGVGDLKLDKYGERFLKLINEIKANNNQESFQEQGGIKNQEKEQKIELLKKLHTTYETTLDLIDKGLSIEQICEKRGFQISTILGHISTLVDNEFLSENKAQELFNCITIDKAVLQWIEEGLKLAGTLDNIHHHLAIFKQLNKL